MSEQTLWIVTAGNSDIQFPLHRLSTGDSARFTPARDVRKLHEALIELAKGGRLTVLNSSQPLRHGRDGGRPDKAWTSGASLQVTGTEDGGLALSYTNPDFVLDLAGTTGVPVHLPKVQPLLDPLRQYGKNLTVVVVGTRRDQDSEEPIAVGPVLCEYLSNQLGLTLSGALDTEGGTRSTLTPGSCVWLNILIGDERLEEIDSQRSMIGRVQEALEAWERGLSAAAQNGSIRRVLVTSSGGMALVKEILERVSAIRFGDGQVSIFKEQPSQQAVSVVISEPYLNRVTERLALRLHCAESFRSMKWYSAYGLAGLVKEDWSRSIKRLIEPLLRLPGNGNIGRDICRPAIHENRVISSLELAAYQLEISWRMGDSVTTLQIFSAFLESAIQRLSENSTRLSAAGGRVRNNATILGLPAHSHDTLFGNMDAERSRRLITGPERRGDKVFSKIRSLVADSAWIDFLCEGVANGSERSALQAAGDLVLKYNERSAPGADDSLRELRNRLAHEIDDGLSNQIRRRLEALFAPAAGQPAPISFLEPNGNVATLVRHPGNVAGNPKEIFESLVRWGSRCIQEGQR